MQIKFSDSDNSRLYITGCLHLLHNPSWAVPLWKMRGYNSAEDMTDGIITRINTTCRESDILFVLGDFCLNTKWEDFLILTERIKPKIWMLEGNHPNPWRRKYYDYCYEKFNHLAVDYEWNNCKYMGNYVELKWNKRWFVCCHYPIWVWNTSLAKMMIHSHCHGGFEPSLPETTDQGKILDVGWDVFKRPLSFEEILEIMDKKDVKKLDKHH